MKKVILSATALAVLVLFSCEKEQLTPTTSNQTLSKTKPAVAPTKINGEPMAVTHWYDNGEKDFGCKIPASDCLEEVIITPGLADMADDIEHHVGNINYLANLVLAHQDDFVNLFGSKITNHLLNKSLTLNVKTNTTMRYILVTDLLGEVKMVRPLSL